MDFTGVIKPEPKVIKSGIIPVAYHFVTGESETLTISYRHVLARLAKRARKGLRCLLRASEKQRPRRRSPQPSSHAAPAAVAAAAAAAAQDASPLTKVLGLGFSERIIQSPGCWEQRAWPLVQSRQASRWASRRASSSHGITTGMMAARKTRKSHSSSTSVAR